MFAFGVPKATVRGAAWLALTGDARGGCCGVLDAGVEAMGAGGTH